MLFALLVMLLLCLFYFRSLDIVIPRYLAESVIYKSVRGGLLVQGTTKARLNCLTLSGGCNPCQNRTAGIGRKRR